MKTCVNRKFKTKLKYERYLMIDRGVKMTDSVQRDSVINGCKYFRAFHAGGDDEKFWCTQGHKLNVDYCVLQCKDRKRETHYKVV